ncbi:MAG TPA: PIN domain-containing protein [Anaerolineales bacterium]|nr:PIN domain-containing protein [Anaerolineales bacterium]
MNGRFLVDTNVLVYAYDRSEPEKQIRALEVLDRLAETQRGVITAQVMAEFFVVVTRKIPAPLSPAQAMERLQNYWLSWQVLDLTPMIVLEAARGVRDHRFSYWDAQIWAAARLNQIPVVMSEDFNSGSTREGVSFVNSFEEGFEFDERI